MNGRESPLLSFLLGRRRREDEDEKPGHALFLLLLQLEKTWEKTRWKLKGERTEEEHKVELIANGFVL